MSMSMLLSYFFVCRANAEHSSGGSWNHSEVELGWLCIVGDYVKVEGGEIFNLVRLSLYFQRFHLLRYDSVPSTVG